MRFFIILLSFFVVNCGKMVDTDSNKSYIRISNDFPRYFEKDGQTWIPIATNYLPNGDFELIEEYFKNFSENGGNAMRIWISTEFLEIEDEKEGTYNPDKFQRIDKLLELAEKYGIYIKFTLHHIRTISETSSPNNAWANSTALATRFKNIDEYVNTSGGRNSYLKRAKALSDRYKDHKNIYGWELWNEMDAVVDEPSWKNFTPQIIDSLKRIFPNRLITQTLGSMHAPYAENFYYSLSQMPQNDFLSIHRYLDEGDKWNQYEIVKGAIDLLASDATQKGLSFTQGNVKPVIINEIGAVEPNHYAPFRLYRKDVNGVLLHDFIFAPFFSGSAGSGTTWHWDHYIEPMNLWYHFKRFKTAIEGIDPVKEKFVPFHFLHDNVRCYGLQGTEKTIIWCRDVANNWKTELENEIPAETKKNFMLSLNDFTKSQYTKCHIYNPWTDTWTRNLSIANDKVSIPDFVRSTVIVFEK